MNPTEHERWKDDIAAHLLGTLSPGEAADLERHVAGCQECRREMRWLRPAVDQLAVDVEVVEPSPDLRLNVMAAVREDVEGATETDGAGERRRRPFLSGFGGWRPVAAIATVALLVAAVAGYAIRDGGSGGAPEATTVASAGKPSGVTATMVSSGDAGILKLENVRDMPPDRVLEAWVQKEGEVEPVRALFVPDRQGRASTTIEDTTGVEVVMVTAEPRGGSDSPTSPAMVTLEMPE
jgi:anti-sigma-K factor RskA